jgi:hypothetical protein
MRCLPTAFAAGDPQRRIRESMDISAITHDDPRCGLLGVRDGVDATLHSGQRAAVADEFRAAAESSPVDVSEEAYDSSMRVADRETERRPQ